MSGLFGNLEISKRALMTHQYDISTAGHNISNVDTEGYSRQQVVLKTGTPLNTIYGQVGNGVTVSQIKRHSDDLLFGHLLDENGNSSEWERREILLHELEAVYNEPSEFGLNKALSDFFTSWSELANHPEMKALKIDVVEKGRFLTESFHRLDSELSNLRERAQDQIEDRIEKLNDYAKQIAELNVSIASVEAGQNKGANDLRDRRDTIVQDMGKLAGVKVREFDSGMVKVMINGISIVENDRVFDVKLRKTSTSDGLDKTSIVFPEHRDLEAKIQSGELKGLMDVRDNFIVEQIHKIDDLARTLVKEVNQIHRKGYGSEDQLNADVNFFSHVVSGARNIELSFEVSQSPELVAASATGAPGDNSVAVLISELKDKKVLDNHTMTFQRFYDTSINLIGLRAEEAEKNKGNHDVLLDQVKNFRESVVGVQMDAELSNLIRFQGAYQAAARVVSTIDKLLDTIINRMAV